MRIHKEEGNQAAYAIALGNRAPIHEALGRFTDCVASAGESLRLRTLLGDRVSSRTPLPLRTPTSPETKQYAIWGGMGSCQVPAADAENWRGFPNRTNAWDVACSTQHW